MEQGEYFFLGFTAQVDQEVPATEQVNLGKRRVFEHVLLGKDHHVADILADAVGAVFLGKKPGQPFRGDIGGNAVGIDPGAGFLNGLVVDIGGKDLDLEVFFYFVQIFPDQDSQGIGFFAGGATRDPDPHTCARELVGKEPGNDLFPERFEGLRVAEEIGDADQKFPKKGLHFQRVFPHVTYIIFDTVDLGNGHAPLDAAADGGLFVLGKIMARLGAQQNEHLLQVVNGTGRWGGDGFRPLAKGVLPVGDQLLRHLVRRKDIVHLAGGDGAAGHSVVGRRFRALDHGHSAFALDRFETQGAVGAGAREHDADRPLMLVLGQGAKEKINRQTQAPRRPRFQQVQFAVQEGHIPVWRNDIGAVGLHLHPVLHLENLHPGVLSDQIDQDAFVVGVQMLHQHKGHPGFRVRRHGGKEGFDGGQTSGRSADPDDGKARRRVAAGLRLGLRRSLSRCSRLPLFGHRDFRLLLRDLFLGHIVPHPRVPGPPRGVPNLRQLF